jgi:hypothetical protein
MGRSVTGNAARKGRRLPLSLATWPPPSAGGHPPRPPRQRQPLPRTSDTQYTMCIGIRFRRARDSEARNGLLLRSFSRALLSSVSPHSPPGGDVHNDHFFRGVHAAEEDRASTRASLRTSSLTPLPFLPHFHDQSIRSGPAAETLIECARRDDSSTSVHNKKEPRSSSSSSILRQLFAASQSLR